MFAKDKKCSVTDCARKIGSHGALGLCSAHYKRSKVGSKIDRPMQIKGAGWTSSHGYVYIGNKGQHRKVIEEILGRPLVYNEVVHHKDGNKRNNDPSNLEVMDRGQHIRLHINGKTNEQRAIEKARFGYCLPNGLGGPL